MILSLCRGSVIKDRMLDVSCILAQSKLNFQSLSPEVPKAPLSIYTSLTAPREHTVETSVLCTERATPCDGWLTDISQGCVLWLPQLAVCLCWGSHLFHVYSRLRGQWPWSHCWGHWWVCLPTTAAFASATSLDGPPSFPTCCFSQISWAR